MEKCLKVDIQDVLFWMDAIRNSSNRYRTLESFWKGQVNSKLWLIENLEPFVKSIPNNLVIYGGWNGVLSSLLFNSEISVGKITSVDIDPVCEEIAYTVNKRQEIDGRFSAITKDMCECDYNADIVINTSCEHITQSQYDKWINNVSLHSLIVLQSNNYFDLDEHIRCAKNLKEFEEQSKLNKILFKGKIELSNYDRYMLIGEKDV